MQSRILPENEEKNEVNVNESVDNRPYFNYANSGSNLCLQLSCLNPRQALLLYIIDERLYQEVYNDMAKELDSDLLLSPSSLQRLMGFTSSGASSPFQVLKNIYHDHIQKNLISPVKAGGIEENLSKGLKYFYRVVAAKLDDKQDNNALWSTLPYPSDAELSEPEVSLEISNAEKQQRIAQYLACKYYQKFSLTLEDVLLIFKRCFQDEEIKNLKQDFLAEILEQKVDEDHYRLKSLLPHRFFLQQALALGGREESLCFLSRKDLSEVFYHAVVQLDNTMKDKDNVSACLKLQPLIDKLIKDAKQIKKDLSANLALTTEILIKVNNLIQNKPTDLTKEISALQNTSWGKIILATLFTITSVALIGLCCASSVGIAIPFFALGASVYVPVLATGIIGTVASVSFFNRGLSSRQAAVLLVEDVDKIANQIKIST